MEFNADLEPSEIQCPSCAAKYWFRPLEASAVYALEPLENVRNGFQVMIGFCPKCACLLVTRRSGVYWQFPPEDDGRARKLDHDKEEILHPRAVEQVSS